MGEAADYVLLHDQHGDAFVADFLYLLQTLHPRSSGPGREKVRRQQEPGPGHQSAGDGDHLLFAAGKSPGQLFHTFSQAGEQGELLFQDCFMLARARGM